MENLWKKLQLATVDRVVLLEAPESFRSAEQALGDVEVVRSLEEVEAVGFLLAFVRSAGEIPVVAKALDGRFAEDPTVWLAYPKKSSKRYESDIERDHSWRPLGELGFEAVRQVAIDEDWSALRFRRVEQIATLRRDPRRAMTVEGKRRAASATRRDGD